MALLISSAVAAQKHDTIPARQVIEKGTKGDSILGNEIKKKQLSAPPQITQLKDSLNKKEAVKPKKKKYWFKKC